MLRKGRAVGEEGGLLLLLFLLLLLLMILTASSASFAASVSSASVAASSTKFDGVDKERWRRERKAREIVREGTKMYNRTENTM